MYTVILGLLLLLSAFPPAAGKDSFQSRLADSALMLTQSRVVYDPAYFSLAYPGGDVPAGKGVCTDVVIRAYRKMGIDLQKEVHEDMAAHFGSYPKTWGAAATDKNIDHRRVPNLMRFFERKGGTQPITPEGKDYLPGDVVCWRLQSSLTHIGVVGKQKSRDGRRPLIIHNIGGGQVLEDFLFEAKIIGHYRWGK